jgi:hypothetical protein
MDASTVFARGVRKNARSHRMMEQRLTVGRFVTGEAEGNRAALAA